MTSNDQAAGIIHSRKSRFERFFSPLIAVHNSANAIERFLILFGALAGAWFTFFDVYPPSDRFAFFTAQSLYWAALFFSLSLANVTAVWADIGKYRRGALLYHSTIWAGWTILCFTAIRPTMATPLAFGLSAMALYEAIRQKLLSNEKRNQ